MATCDQLLDLLAGGHGWRDELHTTAATYITERLTGTPHRSRELLCKILMSAGSANMWIADESIPGEYEQGSLLFDVLHEAFVYSADKGLGPSDTIGLLRIVASALKWVLSYSKTEDLTEGAA